jgi:hypothetical protein
MRGLVLSFMVLSNSGFIGAGDRSRARITKNTANKTTKKV